MAESQSHIILVLEIVRWINLRTDIASRMAVLISSPDSLADSQPPNIGGSVPDVFASSGITDQALIGEAKTARDIETLRSRKQFSDYLFFLAQFSSAKLVVAVPWQCVNQTRSLLRAIQKKTGTQGVEIIVLDGLPG